MNKWILSQDKFELANVNDIYIITEKKLSRIIGYTNGVKCYLGEYETEERAKEILKEIMSFINKDYVYEMPEK